MWQHRHAHRGLSLLNLVTQKGDVIPRTSDRRNGGLLRAAQTSVGDGFGFSSSMERARYPKRLRERPAKEPSLLAQ